MERLALLPVAAGALWGRSCWPEHTCAGPPFLPARRGSFLPFTDCTPRRTTPTWEAQASSLSVDATWVRGPAPSTAVDEYGRERPASLRVYSRVAKAGTASFPPSGAVLSYVRSWHPGGTAIHKAEAGELAAAGLFVSLHLHARPQHLASMVVVSTDVEGSRLLRGAGLCKILHPNFAELTFHALR